MGFQNENNFFQSENINAQKEQQTGERADWYQWDNCRIDVSGIPL